MILYFDFDKSFDLRSVHQVFFVADYNIWSNLIEIALFIPFLNHGQLAASSSIRKIRGGSPHSALHRRSFLSTISWVESLFKLIDNLCSDRNILAFDTVHVDFAFL
jgi:hypothetical protein